MKNPVKPLTYLPHDSIDPQRQGIPKPLPPKA